MCRRATKPGVYKAARKEVLPILLIAVRQRTDVPEVRCPQCHADEVERRINRRRSACYLV